jgi:phosphate starvation-inducible membrane PsiE
MAAKIGRSQIFLALATGVLPWAGGLLVTVTSNILWLAVAGVLICGASTTGAYLMRKTSDPVRAKYMLIVDAMLFGIYFVFSAVVIRYVFLRGSMR